MGRHKISFNDHDKGEIIGLFKSGQSTKQIAKMYYVSEKTIRFRLKDWGVFEVRPRSCKYPQHIRFMIAGLRMNGVSNIALAEQYGISEATVKNYVIEYKQGLEE